MASEVEKRVYVGGLFSTADKEDVSRMFSRFVSVSDVELKKRSDTDSGRDTAFAFVNVKSTDDKLNKCFKQLNGSFWKGKRLRLELARESFLSRLQRERTADHNVTDVKSSEPVSDPPVTGSRIKPVCDSAVTTPHPSMAVNQTAAAAPAPSTGDNYDDEEQPRRRVGTNTAAALFNRQSMSKMECRVLQQVLDEKQAKADRRARKGRGGRGARGSRGVHEFEPRGGRQFGRGFGADREPRGGSQFGRGFGADREPRGGSQFGRGFGADREPRGGSQFGRGFGADREPRGGGQFGRSFGADREPRGGSQFGRGFGADREPRGGSQFGRGFGADREPRGGGQFGRSFGADREPRGGSQFGRGFGADRDPRGGSQFGRGFGADREPRGGNQFGRGFGADRESRGGSQFGRGFGADRESRGGHQSGRGLGADRGARGGRQFGRGLGADRGARGGRQLGRGLRADRGARGGGQLGRGRGVNSMTYTNDSTTSSTTSSNKRIRFGETEHEVVDFTGDEGSADVQLSRATAASNRDAVSTVGSVGETHGGLPMFGGLSSLPALDAKDRQLTDTSVRTNTRNTNANKMSKSKDGKSLGAGGVVLRLEAFSDFWRDENNEPQQQKQDHRRGQSLKKRRSSEQVQEGSGVEVHRKKKRCSNHVKSDDQCIGGEEASGHLKKKKRQRLDKPAQHQQDCSTKKKPLKRTTGSNTNKIRNKTNVVSKQNISTDEDSKQISSTVCDDDAAANNDDDGWSERGSGSASEGDGDGNTRAVSFTDTCPRRNQVDNVSTVPPSASKNPSEFDSNSSDSDSSDSESVSVPPPKASTIATGSDSSSSDSDSSDSNSVSVSPPKASTKAAGSDSSSSDLDSSYSDTVSVPPAKASTKAAGSDSSSSDLDSSDSDSGDDGKEATPSLTGEQGQNNSTSCRNKLTEKLGTLPASQRPIRTVDIGHIRFDPTVKFHTDEYQLSLSSSHKQLPGDSTAEKSTADDDTSPHDDDVERFYHVDSSLAEAFSGGAGSELCEPLSLESTGAVGRGGFSLLKMMGRDGPVHIGKNKSSSSSSVSKTSKHIHWSDDATVDEDCGDYDYDGVRDGGGDSSWKQKSSAVDDSTWDQSACLFLSPTDRRLKAGIEFIQSAPSINELKQLAVENRADLVDLFRTRRLRHRRAAKHALKVSKHRAPVNKAVG